jgi:hypothetical protein
MKNYGTASLSTNRPKIQQNLGGEWQLCVDQKGLKSSGAGERAFLVQRQAQPMWSNVL